MKKVIKSFNTIYGDYITKEFIQELDSVAKRAEHLAKLNMFDKVHKNIHDPTIQHTSEAVDFWEAMHQLSKQWIKENTCKQ